MSTKTEKIHNLIRQSYCAGSIYEIWNNANPKKIEHLTTAEKIELMENNLQSFILKNKASKNRFLKFD